MLMVLVSIFHLLTADNKLHLYYLYLCSLVRAFGFPIRTYIIQLELDYQIKLLGVL